MRFYVLAIFFLLIVTARVDAQVAKPRAKTGPSAASLATPYRGPLKFNARVLAQERATTYDADPITRAASWRYHYSVPAGFYCGYYGYYGCGYGGYRRGGFFGYGGTMSL